MARQGISTGTTPNDGLGDSLLTGAVKINQNFLEIYSIFGNGNTLSSYVNTSGIATYATTAGVATISGYATTSGVATYSLSSGVSTTVSGGFGSLIGLTVAGLTTLSVNSSIDALRITQTGGGNALVVEDETNPDATPVIVTGIGSVGVGTNSPACLFHVQGDTLITGNLNAAGNYYVKLARLTTQTVSNGTDTLIGFSVISDPNNWYSGITTRTTPTVAGTYHVDVMLNWNAGSITNDQTNIQIRKNGTTFALSQVGIHTFGYTQNACGIVTMNGTTDYIDFTVYTANPTSQVVNGTADGAWTKMEIFKIN